MQPIILTPAEVHAQYHVKQWLAALSKESVPYAHEFAKEAMCIWSMYGAREALRWMTIQSACWMMLASMRVKWNDDDFTNLI
jgi:hypothetical protein